MARISKKGQGMPLNVIIVAIILIIVLVAVIGWFVVKFGKGTGQIDEFQVRMQAKVYCQEKPDPKACEDQCMKNPANCGIGGGEKEADSGGGISNVL